MSKFDNILIISDIDKTLLSDDGRICARNVNAIEYFIKNGGSFTVASGRNKNSIQSVLSQVRINKPCLLLNGAMIYDYNKREVLWEQTINDVETSSLLLKIMDNYKDVGIEIFTAKGMCVIRQNFYTEFHKHRDPKNFFSASLEYAPRPWYKAILTDAPDKLKAVSDGISNSGIMNNYHSLRFVFSEDIFLELLPYDVSKGNALLRLLETEKKKYDRVYAIGDNYNDLELLKVADFSIAPENAVDEVKSLADYVMCSNNDGIIGDVVEMIEEE